jgi:hypothetical protein
MQQILLKFKSFPTGAGAGEDKAHRRDSRRAQGPHRHAADSQAPLSNSRAPPRAQASTTSAVSILPRVSGLSNSATIKLAAPATVPISIGIAKPRCRSTAR